MSSSEDLRTAFDAPMLEAKFAFVQSVRDFLLTNDMSQRALAQELGYSPVAISEFLRMPERCPESLIRVASLKIPALANEYLKFRAAVDARFFDAAQQHQGTMDRLMVEARAHQAVVEASKQITEILERLKKLI